MEKFLMNPQKQTITSLELLEQINFFRWKEGNRTQLGHNDLLKIIRDEFVEEIHEGKIPQMFYNLKIGNGATRKSPMYILTLNQARRILTRESRFVRGAMFEYIDKLENNIKYLETEKLGILERENRLLLRENDLLTRENKFLKSQGNILKAPTVAEPKKPRKAIATKRGLIFMITKLEPGFSNDELGYSDLYKAFEEKFNINLTEEMLKLGRTRKVHFIEKDLHKIDELLKIAIELFPTGYKKALSLYRSQIENLK